MLGEKQEKEGCFPGQESHFTQAERYETAVIFGKLQVIITEAPGGRWREETSMQGW